MPQDDAPALAALFAGAVGGHVAIPPGTYCLLTGGYSITLTDNLSIKSDGAVFLFDHSNSTTFQFFGEQISTPAFMGSVSRGDRILTVDSAAGVSQGDLIAIDSTKVYETGSGYTQTETHIVEAVTATTIIFAEPLVFDYDAATDSVVLSTRKARGVVLEGPLEIRYPESAAWRGRTLDFRNVQGCSLSGLTLIDPQRRRGNGPDPVLFDHAVDCVVRDVAIDGCRYPINVAGGSRNTRLENISAQFCWSACDFSTASIGCFAKGIYGRNNHATLGSHPCFELHYEDVTCINGETLSHRSVGGSIRNCRVESDYPWGVSSIQMQNVKLVRDIYPETDFLVESLSMTIPNATARPALAVNENGRRGIFRNVRVPELAVGLEGNVAVEIDNSCFHFIRFRGSVLTSSALTMLYQYPDMPSALRVDFPFDSNGAKRMKFSNIDVIGGYQYMHDAYVLDDIYYDNFYFKDISTDFFTSFGNKQDLHLLLSNGRIVDCDFSIGPINNQVFASSNVFETPGSGEPWP